MFDQMFLDSIRQIVREELDRKQEPETVINHEYITKKQVQEITTLSASSVETLIRKGTLKAYYPSPGRRTFRRAEVEALMEEGRSA